MGVNGLSGNVGKSRRLDPSTLGLGKLKDVEENPLYIAGSTTPSTLESVIEEIAKLGGLGGKHPKVVVFAALDFTLCNLRARDEAAKVNAKLAAKS